MTNILRSGKKDSNIETILFSYRKAVEGHVQLLTWCLVFSKLLLCCQGNFIYLLLYIYILPSWFTFYIWPYRNGLLLMPSLPRKLYCLLTYRH